MNRKIPKELTQKQEHQRQATVNTVLHAVSELKAEGHIIRIKDLMEHTGLSRSVFSKNHIRSVLISQGIVPEKECKPECNKQEQSGDRRLKQRLAEKEQRICRLSDENASLKSECELLRGRLFLLMQRQSFE